MKRFCFKGTVVYPVKDQNDIPKGSHGLHYIYGDDEAETRQRAEKEHSRHNLHFVDCFGHTSKAGFHWFGEV